MGVLKNKQHPLEYQKVLSFFSGLKFSWVIPLLNHEIPKICKIPQKLHSENHLFHIFIQILTLGSNSISIHQQRIIGAPMPEP